MPEVVICADDVTGACDAGVAFCRDFSVDAYLDAESFSPDTAVADVIAVATNSRADTPQRAMKKTAAFLDRLSDPGNTVFLKKTDSMLRGNAGAEAEAFLRDPEAVLIAAPSLPGQGRTVEDGILTARFADGSETRFSAVEKLQETTALPVGRIPLSVVREGAGAITALLEEEAAKGNRLLLADAVTEEDLRNITLTKRTKGSLVFAGSAGLAASLAKRMAKEKKGNVSEKCAPAKGGILLVVGSMSPSTIAQLSFLKREEEKAAFFLIDTADLAGSEASLTKALTDALRGPARCCVLTSRDAYEGRSVDIRENLSVSEITAAFARIASAQGKRGAADRILLSGGDIAEAFFKEMGVEKIRLRSEMLPGIVEASFVTDEKKEIRVVTKSGSFGDVDALQAVCRCFAGNR